MNKRLNYLRLLLSGGELAPCQADLLGSVRHAAAIQLRLTEQVHLMNQFINDARQAGVGDLQLGALGVVEKQVRRLVALHNLARRVGGLQTPTNVSQLANRGNTCVERVCSNETSRAQSSMLVPQPCNAPSPSCPCRPPLPCSLWQPLAPAPWKVTRKT